MSRWLTRDFQQYSWEKPSWVSMPSDPGSSMEF
jgi:hypothetical protein